MEVEGEGESSSLLTSPRSDTYTNGSRVTPVIRPAPQFAEIPLPAADAPDTPDGMQRETEGGGISSVSLLARYSAVPTESRKLAGLKDLGMCMLMLVPYICMKVVRLVLGKLGVSEHRWKGVPNDQPLTQAGRKHLLSVAQGLQTSDHQDVKSFLMAMERSGNANGDMSGGSTPRAGLSDGSARVSEAVVQHLEDVMVALEMVSSQQGLVWGEAHRVKFYQRFAKALRTMAQYEAINLQDAFKDLRHIGKACIKQLARMRPGVRSGEVVKEYVFRCLMLNSLRIPSVQSKGLITTDEGEELVETCTTLSLQPGLEYLRLHGEQFEDHAVFMSTYPRMRPSDVKHQWVAQAMTTNARLHTLNVKTKDGATREVAGQLRSGAFAVHGRKPRGTGLSGLVTAAHALAAEAGNPEAQAALLKRLKYKSMAALEPEIRIRSVCCVAQALPVVVAGLQRAMVSRRCWESAGKTRTFLHVQQSLLSDLNTNEHSYLEDTKGALDILSSRLEIRFAYRPLSQLSLDATTQRITLTLDSSLVPDDVLPSELGPRNEVLARSYRFQGVLFSQGINVLQSLGFFMVRDRQPTLQDLLNVEALEALNSYAQRAGRGGAAGPMDQLNAHYSRKGSRPAKDTEAIWLVRRACADIGGVRAVNCKSGKDRTAIELALTCPQMAVEAGVLRPAQQWELQQRMQGGLSYSMTGENNGQPNAYAFSELELVAMPHGWKPIWQLCGKVMS